jgi:K+-transporting ATPase A subunit
MPKAKNDFSKLLMAFALIAVFILSLLLSEYAGRRLGNYEQTVYAGYIAVVPIVILLFLSTVFYAVKYFKNKVK